MTPAAPVPHVHPGVNGLGGIPPAAPRSWWGRVLERIFLAAARPFAPIVALVVAGAAMLTSRTLMAGVVVETSVRPRTRDRAKTPPSSYFVVGQTERGPTDDVVELFSMSDYTDKLGDRVTYGTLYDDLTMFFAEGGTRALVARIVGTTPDIGLRTFPDRAVAPASTIRVLARTPGSWSTRVSIAITDSAIMNQAHSCAASGAIGIENRRKP